MGALTEGSPRLDEGQDSSKKWRTHQRKFRREKIFRVKSILLIKVFPHVQSKHLMNSQGKIKSTYSEISSFLRRPKI